MNQDELLGIYDSYLSAIESTFTNYRGLLDAIMVRGKGATQDQLIALSVMADFVESEIVATRDAAKGDVTVCCVCGTA